MPAVRGLQVVIGDIFGRCKADDLLQDAPLPRLLRQQGGHQHLARGSQAEVHPVRGDRAGQVHPLLKQLKYQSL